MDDRKVSIYVVGNGNRVAGRDYYECSGCGRSLRLIALLLGVMAVADLMLVLMSAA